MVLPVSISLILFRSCVVFLLPVPGTPSTFTVGSSLVLVVSYYICADISIDTMNKYICVDMCRMTIYADIETVYNMSV